MPCLNFRKRLQPARRAWKMLTSKLQRELHKLHKLHKSKSIRKPKKQLQPYKKRSLTRPHHSFLQSLHRCKKRKKIETSNMLIHRYVMRRKTSEAPVFVDELFNARIEEATAKATKDECSTDTKVYGMIDCGATASGTSEEGGRGSAGDELWETLGVGSPQMKGIDKRAEEFIAKFRAEMGFEEIRERGS